MSIKASLNGDVRRFSLEEKTYTELEATLRQIYQLSAFDNIKVTYLDEDEDRITVSSDMELTEAIGCTNGRPLKIIVTLRDSSRRLSNDLVAAERRRQEGAKIVQRDEGEMVIVSTEKVEANNEKAESMETEKEQEKQAEAPEEEPQPSEKKMEQEEEPKPQSKDSDDSKKVSPAGYIKPVSGAPYSSSANSTPYTSSSTPSNYTKSISSSPSPYLEHPQDKSHYTTAENPSSSPIQRVTPSPTYSSCGKDAGMVRPTSGAPYSSV